MPSSLTRSNLWGSRSPLTAETSPPISGMHARSKAIVEVGGRLAYLHSEPPLTIRKVFSEKQGECALCLVGSAAGPLPGDDLSLALELEHNAQASLTASGACVAQGRKDQLSPRPARMKTLVQLGDNAGLVADPGALIVCAGADIDVELDIRLAASATLIWRETLVLGRRGEPAGLATLSWNVIRDEKPLLRQRLDLREDHLRTWSGMTRNYKVIVTELRVGPTATDTIVHSSTDVTQQIADDVTLRTTLRD